MMDYQFFIPCVLFKKLKYHFQNGPLSFLTLLTNLFYALTAFKMAPLYLLSVSKWHLFFLDHTMLLE